MGKLCMWAVVTLALVLPSQASSPPPDFNGRPRGVAKSKLQFYDASKPFTCLDGSRTMPFNQVNDDFCDCADGTDEPGTPACSSLGGKFHCANKGHKPAYIPASRVNDGICDCCDGSDEYDGRGQCTDTCKELGAKAREEARKLLEVQQRGHQLRQEYSQQGTAKQDERRNEVSTLDAQLKEAQAEVDRLHTAKEEAEAPETEAKDAHKAAWDAKKAEEQRAVAEAAFRDLDSDSDGTLTVAEIQTRAEFDKDQSGDVSEDEAKEWLGGEVSCVVERFATDLWKNISDVYVTPGSVDEPATPMPAVEGEEMPPSEPPTDGNADEGDKTDNAAEEGMPEYDEATQELIKTADAARGAYDEANKKKDDLQRQIDDLNKLINVDLGSNNEFQALQGNCYDFTDREYTYSVCPFDRVSQKPKHGGSETSLGTWGKWDGPDSDKYSVMKFENGLNCWNGPNRSGTVKLRCGENTELVSAAEPNRCEYHFELVTPAVCEAPSTSGHADSHDEL